MLRNHKFRQQCLRSGYTREATEMLVYINQATNEGQKGSEVFERKTLVDKVQFAILGKIKYFQPHIGNIEKLYDDPEYRLGWVAKYNRRIGQH